jgi:3-methyladenine DNA glycosylase/8-oxoguanine DNA glycosylase
MPGTARRWRTDRPLDLVRTVAPLRHGSGDPTWRFVGGVFWRAASTPAGAATISVSVTSDEVTARAWGPGADWLLSAAPGLIGETDDWTGLDVSGHRVLHQVRRQYPGVRLCRTGLVLDSLVPACLEQRVTGPEAFRAWRELVRGYGEPAPGPAEVRLWVPPGAAEILQVPTWDWHRYGVDHQRYKAIRAAATVADRLEECRTLDPDAALSRLRLVPGVGEWTAAEVAIRALGHPDAVSVGDFHLKNLVGYALTGAPRSDDATMLALLEPWRGHRARVVRLVELSELTPPRYGPRFNYNDIRAI